MTEFYYHVNALVPLSLEELQILMSLSECHYDLVCKQAGREGGFVRGLFVEALHSDSKKVEAMLTSRQIDTLLKVLEGLPQADKTHWRVGTSLTTKLRTTFHDIRTEWSRLNPAPKE